MARLQELDACRRAGGYAGEVALSEEELVNLGPIVARELGRVAIKRAISGRFILLAINCCYYRTDLEGFWKPFCALLGWQPLQTNINLLRQRSESALKQWGFQYETYLDGFRYVTPIRLQTGLTLHDLPAFALVLTAGRERFGWSQMQRIPHHEWLAFLEEVAPPTKFTRFLREERGGAALTRDVLRDLVHWRNGIAGDAAWPSEIGYRPKFWEELLSHLQPDDGHDDELRATGVAMMPRFVLDDSRKQLGLSFPQDGVNRRAYRLAGQVIYEGFTALTRLENLQSQYGIKVKIADSEWIESLVHGWKPTLEQPWALFLAEGEYLPHGNVAPPGSYHLVGVGSAVPPEGVHYLTTFEWVDLADATMRVWQIELDAASDPAPFGYRRGRGEDPALIWAEEGRTLRGAADTGMVFLGELPQVRITQAANFREGRMALCCDFGGGVHRLPVPGQGESATLRLEAFIPCRGEVWVESLGRTRAETVKADRRLSFCLLPNCGIDWPETLCTEEEEPELRFSAASGVAADFPDCERVAEAKEPTWRVPRGQHWVEGELTAGEVCVRVATQIFRAAVETESGAPLVCGRSELGSSDTVRVRGWPGIAVRLRVRTSADAVELPLVERFDRHGVAPVQRCDLRDAIRRLPAAPIATLEVWGGARWVETRGAVFDLTALNGWLYDHARDSAPEWLGWLGESCAVMLHDLVSQVEGSREPFALPPNLPVEIADWAQGVMACAWTFRDADHRPHSEVLEAARRSTTPERCRFLEWVLRAEAALKDGVEEAAGLVAEWSEPLPLPVWEPWHEHARSLRVQLALIDALEPLISEWSVDVQRGLAAPRSEIGRMPGGDALTRAYAHHLHHFSPQSPRLAFQALFDIPTEAPSIVDDLRSLLNGLIRVRNGSRPEGQATRCHRRLRPLISSLHTIAARNAGEVVVESPLSRAGTLPPNQLPLPPDDIAMLQAALDGLPPNNDYRPQTAT